MLQSSVDPEHWICGYAKSLYNAAWRSAKWTSSWIAQISFEIENKIVRCVFYSRIHWYVMRNRGNIKMSGEYRRRERHNTYKNCERDTRELFIRPIKSNSWRNSGNFWGTVLPWWEHILWWVSMYPWNEPNLPVIFRFSTCMTETSISLGNFSFDRFSWLASSDRGRREIHEAIDTRRMGTSYCMRRRQYCMQSNPELCLRHGILHKIFVNHVFDWWWAPGCAAHIDMLW
jgi:hypothetical protein